MSAVDRNATPRIHARVHAQQAQRLAGAQLEPDATGTLHIKPRVYCDPHLPGWVPVLRTLIGKRP